MAMRVIYHLNTSNLKNIPNEARWAESMGYDGLSAEETAHDPFFPLLLAATATSTVTLETRVAMAFPRSPMVVAYSAMDLQSLSAGRFRLGLGTQVKGHIERRFSVKWEAPGPRLKEYIRSLHAIWDNWQSGDKLDFQGRYYTFDLMTPFFSPGPSAEVKPPVYISAINPYNCRVVGEVCDGISLHGISSKRYLTEVIIPNISQGAERAGRSIEDIKINGSPFVITGPDRRTIAAQKAGVKRQLAFYFSTRTYSPVLAIHGFQEVSQRLHELSLQGEWDRMSELITDEILEPFVVAGEYGEVAGLVKQRFGDALDEIVLNLPVSPGSEGALKGIIGDLQS
jgi:probable F420-dependent oxidoreductase